MTRNALSALSISLLLSLSSSAFAEEEADSVVTEEEADSVVTEPPRAAVPLDRRGNPRLTFSADEELLPPVGYQLERRPIAGLVYGGIGAIAGGYGMSALVSGFDYLGSHGDGPWAYALIPVAGPIIAATMDPDSLAMGFYVASGVVQNLGVAMLIVGATVQRPFFTAVESATESVQVGFGPGSFTVSGSF